MTTTIIIDDGDGDDDDAGGGGIDTNSIGIFDDSVDKTINGNDDDDFDDG